MGHPVEQPLQLKHSKAFSKPFSWVSSPKKFLSISDELIGSVMKYSLSLFNDVKQQIKWFKQF